MRALVVDSSVVIKWIVQEQGTAEALSLRRYRLSAPDLLVPECANILWKKVRRGELTEREAILGARLLERADVELMPMRPFLASSVELAIALDHPAYDCTYLILAQTSHRDLVTADERLCSKIANRGIVSCRVIPLMQADASTSLSPSAS